MAHFEKHFTLGEATALLPEVREILESAREIVRRLPEDWQEAEPVLRAAASNGGGSEARAYLSDLHALNRILGRLTELGVQLKDIETGLVDFPSWQDGREVFLCWRLGEDAIAFWHELEAGVAGRRPL
jgi:hypothetical protein